MRLLVDTNVFLDLFFDREQYGEIAQSFFDTCVKKKNQIYVTSMSLRDIGYTAHKYSHSKEVAKAAQIATYEACSKVIDISADSAITSLYSDVDDYEDSLIIEAAKESMVDAIVTNNKKDFKLSEVPVFSPREIVEYLNNN